MKLCKINPKEMLSPTWKHYGEFQIHMNGLMGYFNRHSNFHYLCEIGSRKSGKSVFAQRGGLANNAQCHDNIIYYFRLTEKQIEKLLANNAKKMFEKKLVDKYFTSRGYVLRTHGNAVYAHKQYKVTKGKNKGKIEVSTKPEWKVAEAYALSTFYNDKGVADFDFEFLKENSKHKYWVIVDEFQKEEGERKQGDLAYEFVNALHNKFRDTHYRFVVCMLCNNLRESSEILSGCFNFMPIKYGTYVLHSKKCIIDYWQPTENYKEMMKKGATSLIQNNDDATFSNEFKHDMELVVKRKKYRPSYIIRFSKSDSDCYIVWDDRYIERFEPKKRIKATLKNGKKVYREIERKLPNIRVIPMVRFLDVKFDKQLQKAIFEQVDQRYFLFESLMTKTQFEVQIKLLRSEK